MAKTLLDHTQDRAIFLIGYQGDFTKQHLLCCQSLLYLLDLPYP